MPEERARTPAPKSGSRARYNRILRLVRRVHLYAGLIMTPWVFLYGITACLFNHPDLFPDQEVRSISSTTVAGTPIEQFPSAEELAGKVVDAINADSPQDEQGTSYRLIRPEEAEIARDYSTSVSDGRQDYSVRLDLERGTGTIRTSPSRGEPDRPEPAPFASNSGIVLDLPPLNGVVEALPTLLARAGLPTEGIAFPEVPGQPRERRTEGGPQGEERVPRGNTEAGERRGGGRSGTEAAPPAAPAGRGGRFGGPELSFLMEESQGKVWKVGYNLQTGVLSGTPEGSVSGEAPSTRRFLLRLHTAHGYSKSYDARWFWALIVDLMSVSMVGWGLTGMLMWWQMKNVRRVGAFVLILGLLASLAAAFGMHNAMVGGP